MSLDTKFGAGNAAEKSAVTKNDFAAAAELTAVTKNDFSRALEGTIAARPFSYHFNYENNAPGGGGDTTAPTITSSATASVAENAAFSLTLTANESVTWTKTGGADAALFTLSGNTLTMTAKNFEAPADADANNTYVVQVTATDAASNATNQTITVTVTDVDEVAPTITSSATPSVAENAGFSLTLTANETVTWTKTGGADQALFTLTGNTLTMAAKNFEAPSDADTNNVYVVQVTATDTAGNSTAQTISVTVTNVAEVTLAALTLNELTALQNSAWAATITGKTAGSTITATSSDGATLTVTGTTVTGTFTTTGSKTITLTETISDATNSPRASTQTVVVAAAVTETFTAQNSTDWNNWGTDVSISSGRLRTNCNANYTALSSSGLYNLKNRFVSINLVTAPLNTLVGAEAYLQVTKTISVDEYMFVLNAGTLRAAYRVSGTVTDGATATYSATTHAFWRIREHNGTVYWEVSNNGTTWTVFYSRAVDFAISACMVRIMAGDWNGQTTGFALWDTLVTPLKN